MTHTRALSDPKAAARLAGALYLVIIVLGIWSEVAVRGALVIPGDPAATAANILAAKGLVRLSFAADSVMALADAALAVLLYLIFRPVSLPLALMAMVFRLVQTAIIAMNLLNQQAALLILDAGGLATGLAGGEANALAALSLALQRHGYDLGLIFFGVNSLLTGYLVIRSGFLPGLIGAMVMAAGAVYLTGSYLLFLAPALAGAFAPAYIVPLVAESAFCLWLLARGVDGPAVAGR